MKTMTCKQLGGACDKAFTANTFEDIKEMSMQHGMEMFQQNDVAHLEAMNKMKELMTSSDSDAMNNWMKRKQAEFDALPHNK